ncbi:hypothetical protein EIP91_007203 [Steccherinum ochraceum]|uniref:DUF6533 domain-containing protein n=1 Tax=Steccherinum ochraceum TaxID=92696 RepID=A0A4R0RIU6_9APHY|nr:hypothetical protein EIP91_007203 [Steccherinum ochraceum]
MSNDQAASDFQAVLLNNYLVASAVVVLYWEFLLTLPDEIQLYWHGSQRILSWAPLFFFLNRYSALIGHVPVMVEFFSRLPEPSSLSFVHTPLYERSRKILVFLTSLMVIAWIVATWAVVAGGNSSFNPVGHAFTGGYCDLSLSEIEGRYFAGGWGTVLAFDTIVFALTLYKRLRVGKTPDKGLFSLMIRDGTVYFGIIAVLFSIDIATFLVTGPLYKGIVITYTNVFSSILMSRMMLNVRRQSVRFYSRNTAITAIPMSAIEYARPPDGDYTATQVALMTASDETDMTASTSTRQ